MRDNSVEPTIRDYLKEAPTVEELQSLANKMGLRPSDFIRKGEADFKENNLHEIMDDDQALMNAMNRFPKIMERPIVVKGEKAVMGRPPENVLELLS